MAALGPSRTRTNVSRSIDVCLVCCCATRGCCCLHCSVRLISGRATSSGVVCAPLLAPPRRFAGATPLQIRQYAVTSGRSSVSVAWHSCFSCHCHSRCSRYQGPLAHLATHVLVSYCVFDRREVKLLFDCRGPRSTDSRSQLFITVPHDVWLKHRSSLRTRCRHYPGVFHKHRFTLLQCGASSH